MKTIRIKNEKDLPKNFTGIVEYPLFPFTKHWYKNGVLHRVNGPAIERHNGRKGYWIFGQELSEEQFGVFQTIWKNTPLKQRGKLKKTIFHNDFLENFFDYDEVPEKFTGCIIGLSGSTSWLKNGKFHREDGPAFIWENGTKKWFQNNKKHRLDGSAVQWNNGDEEYWILDEELTKEEFESFRAMWESTLQKKTQKLMKAFVKLVKVK